MELDTPHNLDNPNQQDSTYLKKHHVYCCNIVLYYGNVIIQETIVMLPFGGCGNLAAYFTKVFLNILVSCADPGHPATTEVNLISKSHTAMIFYVGYPCRPTWFTISSAGTTTGI
jgi:hypothetical protein